MYKKLLLSWLAVMTAATLCARHLSPQEALSRATSASTPGAPYRAPSDEEMRLTRTVTVRDSLPAVYLFQGKTRALVLPGDDRAVPVLGYMDGKVRGQLPPQLEWWLQEYARQIDHLMSQPESGAGIRLSLSRRNDESPEKAPIPPMMTTTWDQTDPYNYFCPEIDGEKTITGCIATSGAQILKHFRYPEGPLSGTISYTDNYGNYRTLALDGKAFDWDNMLDSYTGGYTDAQRDAVAFLMQAAGHAAKMDYGITASAAYTGNMLINLKKHFGYNSAAKILIRDNYPPSLWEDMVYENLRTVGPMIYEGVESSFGHSFICDGYAPGGFFHFNWGWGGFYNGYFKLSALIPSQAGTEGYMGNLTFWQDGVFNLTIPGAPVIDIAPFSPLTLYANLRAILNEDASLTFSADEYHDLFIINESYEEVSVEFGVKAVGITTGKQTIRKADDCRTFAIDQQCAEVTLPFPDGLPDGLYRVNIVTRDCSGGEWLDLTHPLQYTDYVNILVSGGKIAAISSPEELDFDISGLQIGSAVIPDYALKLSFSARNSSGNPLYGGVTPVLFIMSDEEPRILGVGDPIAIDMNEGTTKDFQEVTTIHTYDEPIPAGEAYLGLHSLNTGEILDYIPVTVAEAPGAIETSDVTFSIAGDPEDADANNLEFHCGMKVTSGYWANNFTVYLGNETDWLAFLYSDDLIFLSPGESASTVIRGQMPGGKAGESYYATFGYLSPENYVIPLDEIVFKVGTPYSAGIEDARSEQEGAIAVTVDPATGILSVTAPSAIASVEAWSLDGRLLSAGMTAGESRAVSARPLPRGLSIVKVILTDGTSSVVKVTR